MNRSSSIRRLRKLFALAPVYGVPAGLVVAFLVLAGARGPHQAPAAGSAPPMTGLASLVSAAEADPTVPAAAPPRTVAASPARPAAPARISAARPARNAARVRPAQVARPVSTQMAVALVGPTIEDLGEPVCDASESMTGELSVPAVGGVEGCPFDMQLQVQVVNAGAVPAQVRRELAEALRKACAHEIVVRRVRRASGAI